MKHGFLIPVYKHGATACLLAGRLSAFDLPVIIVDDGNDADTRTLLAQFAARTPGVALVSLKKNTGKGGAVTAGLKKAAELELTHVLQIDADGQHDAGKADFFLTESAKYPGKLICGSPEFDATAPKGRVKGRKISNFWASVVTLSSELKDVLCGFRVYPVDAALRIIRCPFLDKRMGFDAEILVRLYWKKVFPVFYPIKVSYPPDGVSNFRMVRDNIRISCMFSRLCAGMILRLPLLIARKIKRGKGS
jgi:glycosyltransferase involved in cell wall biosynthesis